MSSATGNSFVFAGLPRALPAGYAVAPIFPAETGSLRLCVVVRSKDGPFVLLRETLDARVYLGCYADAAGRAHEWVEVWVQDPNGLAGAISSYREALTNNALDDRWSARVRLRDQAEPGGVVATGYEDTNPPPIVIDVKALRPVPAKDARGASWALCKDEGLLTGKGLPSYAGSLSRSLYQPEAGGETPFLPTDMLDARSLGIAGDVALLNGGGGLMMVQRYCPLGYEEFVDAITGIEGAGGASDALLGTIAASARGAGAPDGGWLMLSARTPEARLAEVLHLKVLLAAQAAAGVRAQIAATNAPMLNVTSGSFRVRLGEYGGAAPLWWSARVSVVEPGEGVELPIPGTDAKYFVAGRGAGLSIYAPAGASQPGSGKGWLRLRNVIAEDAGGQILEGTLSTQDRVVPGKNDLLWLRFAVGPSRVNLYAMVDAKGSMVPGEVRLRTIPHQFKEDVAARLKQALGVPIPEVTFEILPLLSSPCDLYAMGVLLTRTLLTGKGVPLPVAMDELLSLAGVVAKDAGGGEDFHVRLERAYTSEKRWAETLGPQVLLAGVSPDAASCAVPPRLWLGVLGATIRCFSGLSADSRCRDFGDAPPGGLHRVFDGLIDDLYALLSACRTLIVSDYVLNAEVRTVIRACMNK